MKHNYDPFGPKLRVQIRLKNGGWNHRKTFELDKRKEAEEYLERLKAYYRERNVIQEYRILETERQEPCWAF